MAEGDVALTNGAGGTVTAPRGEMTLNAQNQPQSVVMSGGVKYLLDDPLKQDAGRGGGGVGAAFDKVGHPEHVVMTGAVHLHEKVRLADAAAAPWSERGVECECGGVGFGHGQSREDRDARCEGHRGCSVEGAQPPPTRAGW